MLIPKCCKGCSGRGGGVCNCTLPIFCNEWVEDDGSEPVNYGMFVTTTPNTAPSDIKIGDPYPCGSDGTNTELQKNWWNGTWRNYEQSVGNWVKCPDCEKKNKEIRDLTNKIKKLEKKQKAHIESIEGFVASSKKKNNKIERLKKGISKAQKNADKTINASKKIKNSKAFDIATIATQLEKERELNEKVKDKDHRIAVLEKALELACKQYYEDCGEEDCPYGECPIFDMTHERCWDCPDGGDRFVNKEGKCWYDYFIHQAEKELEGKDAD